MKNLKIGACTWIFGNMPLENSLDLLREMGFDGVELMGNPQEYKSSGLEHLLNDLGLDIFSLTPANVDLAHPDGTIRSEAIDYYSRLLDFAAELGAPTVSCHGLVGRIRTLSSQAEEWTLFVEAVREISAYAQPLGLQFVMEGLNRYESHLLNTVTEIQLFLKQVKMDNVGILLDAYHMNIEEPDPAGALRQAGKRLWLYHVSDSNRKGIGLGHIDFEAQAAALKDIEYTRPIIVECTAPGADPFRVSIAEDSLASLQMYLRKSRNWLCNAFQ